MAGRGKKLLIWVPMALGVAAVLWAVNARQGPQRIPPEERTASVRTVPATSVDAVPRALGYGNVKPGKVWEAVAEVSGTVIFRHPELQRGAILPAGTELLRIDPADYRLAVAQIEANIRAVEAQIAVLEARAVNTRRSLAIEERSVALGRAQLERTRELLRRGAVSQSEGDREERSVLAGEQVVQNLRNAATLLPAERAVQEAARDQLRAQLETARRNLSRTTIAAPFTCRIAAVNVELAQFAAKGQILVEADSLDVAEVIAQVPIGTALTLLPPGFELPQDAGAVMPRLREIIDIQAVVRLRTGDVSIEWPGPLLADERYRGPTDPHCGCDRCGGPAVSAGGGGPAASPGQEHVRRGRASGTAPARSGGDSPRRPPGQPGLRGRFRRTAALSRSRGGLRADQLRGPAVRAGAGRARGDLGLAVRRRGHASGSGRGPGGGGEPGGRGRRRDARSENPMIGFFAGHPTAANLLMLAFLMVGLAFTGTVKRETFPDIPADSVEVRVPFPGAAALDVEEAICLRIQDVADAVDNREETRCEAREGLAVATLVMREGGDIGRFLNDVKTEIDGIQDFPAAAEAPVVRQLGRRDFVASIAVAGPLRPEGLKAYAERMKDDLLAIPGVAQVRVQGFSQHQIRIEVPAPTMRQFGLSVGDLADAVAAQSLTLPAGSVETRDTTVLIRFDDERRTPGALEGLVVVASESGAVIRLGDIATITDRFERDEDKSFFNGQRAAYLAVEKGREDDTLDVIDALRAYLDVERGRAPPDMVFEITRDVASIVRDRLTMLLRNGIQGLGLVFLVMWLFFGLRYSFWVAAGLPVAFMGTIAGMAAIGYSFDMITMVALLIAVGLIMDDAIVIAENIARQRRAGRTALEAAVEGTKEVAAGRAGVVPHHRRRVRRPGVPPG